MKVAVFSTKPYDQRYLQRANERHGHELTFFEPRLVRDTAALAAGHDAVCAFVNDQMNADVLRTLKDQGVALIALRLVPVYMNSFTVGSIVDNVASDAGLSSRDRREIRQAFNKRLNINDVDVVDSKMLQFEEVAGGVRLVVEYEHRVGVIGNLDVVASFRKEAVLRN